MPRWDVEYNIGIFHSGAHGFAVRGVATGDRGAVFAQLGGGLWLALQTGYVMPAFDQ
jgi:hypothetical protein